MTAPIVHVGLDDAIATVSLNDPAKRNAMSIAMFEALDRALADIAGDPSIHIVLLRGEGAAFCAGFDLAAAQADPAALAEFILRLSGLNRTLRRMPPIIVASVQGAAIAGGCAVLSACDFVFVAADATLGYPVHQLGISPAVTIPTLQQAILPGPARTLLMGGELISGADAHRIGLASHLSASAEAVAQDARAFCKSLARKGVQALRITKAWLNELDGSLDDSPFDGPAYGTAKLGSSEETRLMLARWQAQRGWIR